MKSIVLIVPYLGKWPLWFDAHLVSIAQNPTVNWLFITDCNIPKNYPENIRFVTTTLESLNTKINNVLEINVPLSPRKLCDIRPAYGQIFQEYIKDYDFWGFCDVDIIWGDIRSYVTEPILSEYDIISSRKDAVSGHFTILRNTAAINSLYLSIPDYRGMLSQNKLMRIDEEAFTAYLKTPEIQLKCKIWWQDYLMNNKNGKAHQEYYLDRWIWQEGKMINTKNGQEVMYLHFINWKRTMKFSEVKYIYNPEHFYVSYNGMHYRKHSILAKKWNNFTNLFDGFNVRERNRVRKHKIKFLQKRIVNKIKKL